MATSTGDERRRWYVLLTVGIGTFLSSLNTSITNTILPAIERAMHITLSQSAWVVLVYLLVLTLFLLPVGRMSDVWGHRRIFLLGFALFTCASVLCGFTGNYTTLLWGRALLGLAGSMILAVGPALLASTFPAEQRGRVLGVQAIMTYIGLSLGPALGGWLTQLWGWPITFFMAVPFGITGLALGVWSVPKGVADRRRRLDLKGFFLFITAMTAVTLLLNSNTIMQQRTLIIALLLVCFGISALTFVYVERRQPDPMLDLRLFRIRNFRFGTLGAALNYLCFFLALFLLPFYLDRVFHFSASEIGTFLTITPLVMTVCAPIAGALSDRIGPRPLTASGMLFSTLGLVLFALMGKESTFAGGHWTLVVGLVLAGLGTGSFAAPNNSAILGAAPGGQQGVASGTLATFRYIGMMAGITVGGSLFDLLLGYFTNHGSSLTSSFLESFSIVMWVGALFGAVGIVCTLAMAKANHKRVRHRSVL